MQRRTHFLLSLVALTLIGAVGPLSIQAGSGRVVPDPKGMTWVKYAHDEALGVDWVGCPDGDPYHGDTSCKTALPILCLNQDGSPNPGIDVDYYHGWASGSIGVTEPIVGLKIRSLEHANELCAALGDGYRMAEFHDGGGGWNWAAYGELPMNQRFWTLIDDQPNGNCFPLP